MTKTLPTEVINYRHELARKAAVESGRYVYVGRHPDLVIGKWGNRYSHKIVPGTVLVNTVSDAVERHQADMLANVETVEQIKQELKGKVLACWCRPVDGFKGRHICHAQTLAAIADGIDPTEVK